MGRSSRAFTLIELLVVISIISLLSSTIIASAVSVREKARIAAGLQFSSSLYRTKGADIVGKWDFNEGSGTVATDSSGSGNNGTINNATWSADTASDKQKNSLSFNGWAWVSIPYKSSFLIGTRGFTYSAWIKPTSLPIGLNTIMSQYSPSFGVYNSGSDPIVLQLSFNSDPAGSPGIVTGSTALTINKWYHVAATVNETGMATIYLDGKIDATSGPFTGLAGLTENFLIGRVHSVVPFYFFRGNIDEVRFYNYALGLAEIEKLYAQSLSEHLSPK